MTAEPLRFNTPQQNPPVVTVQRALGHANASVTLNTYAHQWPTAEDKTRAAVAAVLADALGADSADSVRTSGQ